MKTGIRVGTGSGFSDDRFEPAADLAERGAVDYLVFECLAERTIARETLARLKNPEGGYTPYLVERFPRGAARSAGARPGATCRSRWSPATTSPISSVPIRSAR